MAKTFIKEWEKQKNAQEAADAYAQAEYYKRKNNDADSDDEVEER